MVETDSIFVFIAYRVYEDYVLQGWSMNDLDKEGEGTYLI